MIIKMQLSLQLLTKVELHQQEDMVHNQVMDNHNQEHMELHQQDHNQDMEHQHQVMELHQDMDNQWLNQDMEYHNNHWFNHLNE